MPTYLTRDCLTFIWADDGPGMTWYAYAPSPLAQRPEFPSHLWADSQPTISASELFDHDWLIWLWDMKVSRWPNDWRLAVAETLTILCDRGCRIAWCGSEFSEPPQVFAPEMADFLYAAYSPATGFLCNTDLDDEYRGLEPAQLAQLERVRSPDSAGPSSGRS